jgi:hypothetical protein
MSCNTSTDTNIVAVTVTRGDTLRLKVELLGAGGSVSVENWTWLCQLRDSSDTVVGDFTVTVTDSARGLLELFLPAGKTSTLEVADYSWDLQGTDDTGDVRTLVNGRLRVHADVSRSTA